MRIRQCIDIMQAELNKNHWDSSTETPVTQPRGMEVRSTLLLYAVYSIHVIVSLRLNYYSD